MAAYISTPRTQPDRSVETAARHRRLRPLSRRRRSGFGRRLLHSIPHSIQGPHLTFDHTNRTNDNRVTIMVGIRPVAFAALLLALALCVEGK